jgi:peptidyl-prolyl cis-trans isomerase B (cyclophilin B)
MVSTATALLAMLFSVLVPQKTWFNPTQPLTVNVKSDKDVRLELTDFTGKPFAAQGSADVAANQSADIKQIFPDAGKVGTYVLYALPKGTAPSKSGTPSDFLGTPLVIEVFPQPMPDAQGGQLAMITHIEPLQYVVMTTDDGPMTEAFYYDAAPHTIDNYLSLCQGGYYEGTVFHRVHPGFVIQGGDPLSTDPDPQKHGMGGPGYTVPSEFNDRPHLEGVLSMARSQDPNSAGSQFFVCLDYSQTQQLDHQYTAFGKVTDGMDSVKTIAAAPIDGETPKKPVAITKVEVFPVTAQKNPYTSIITAGK